MELSQDPSRCVPYHIPTIFMGFPHWVAPRSMPFKGQACTLEAEMTGNVIADPHISTV